MVGSVGFTLHVTVFCVRGAPPPLVVGTFPLSLNTFTVGFVHNIIRFITMLCGTNSTLWNIPHIHIECEKYSAKYCQSHKTLL